MERLESVAMWRSLLVLAIAAGCGGPPFDHPMASSPLLAAEWPVPFGAGPVSGKDGADGAGAAEVDGGVGGADVGGVRGRMVAAARLWLRDAAERPELGYGARDLDEILARAVPEVSWDAEGGLHDLVALARKLDAYRGDGRPRPGDIALFHNQYDANANGEADDWLTGAAVVVEADGPRFTAVTRTGRAPREIVAWPDGPSVEKLDGEKINSYLRIPDRADPKDAEYLAGDLFAGHVDIEALEASSGAR